jgi:sugar phosphate isomerase/epimerase
MVDVKFPAMRREVARAACVLADADYQRRLWWTEVPPGNGVFDWNLVFDTLYDDTHLPR